MTKRNRPYKVATKSQVRRWFGENARLLRTAYAYDHGNVSQHLELGRFVEGGIIELIRENEDILSEEETGNG